MSPARPRRSWLLALGLTTGTLALGACDAGPTNPDPEVLFRTTAEETAGDTTTTGGPEEPTGAPTAGEPTATESNGTSPGESESESEGGGEGSGSGYGKCGWIDWGYYACPEIPGEVDPDGIYPIDCPEPLPAPGAACGELTPIGCCTPAGTVYFCNPSNEKVYRYECGT